MFPPDTHTQRHMKKSNAKGKQKEKEEAGRMKSTRRTDKERTDTIQQLCSEADRWIMPQIEWTRLQGQVSQDRLVTIPSGVRFFRNLE